MSTLCDAVISLYTNTQSGGEVPQPADGNSGQQEETQVTN